MLEVVLIDDEYFFRNSLKRAIPWDELGFRIVGDANNGRDGYHLILEKHPDIAIIDINMPLINGLELIERLRREQIPCKCILLTGYGDFKYAQQAIRLNVSEYILKPVNFTLLTESLNNLKQEISEEQEHQYHVKALEEHRIRYIKEHFLLDIIDGHVSFNKLQLSSYLEELHISIPFDSYTVSIIEIPEIRSSNADDMRKSFESSLYPDGDYEIFLNHRSHICLIRETECPGNSKKEMETLADALRQKVSAFHIGVSALHKNAQEIIIAYKEASVCLKNARSFERSILFYDEWDLTAYRIPETELTDIKKQVRRRDLPAITETLNRLYDIFREKRLSYDNVIFCTYELLSSLLSALNEQNSINCFLFRDSRSLSDTLDSLHSCDEIRLWMVDLFTEQLSQEESAASICSVTRNVQDYILQHYNNPELTIEDIAQNLFQNYSYLCYCFKRDEGITINDYINQIRLSKALELFHSGVDNVGYVAEATGFNNAGYFSRKFKKYVGLPPSEYVKTL